MTATMEKRESGATIVLDAAAPTSGGAMLVGAWAPRRLPLHDPDTRSTELRAVAEEASSAKGDVEAVARIPRRLPFRVRPVVASIGVALLALAAGSMFVGGVSGTVEPMVLGGTYATTGTLVLVVTGVRA